MGQPSYLFLVRDGENSCPLSTQKIGNAIDAEVVLMYLSYYLTK